MVYPGAVHSRFEHSLGVYWLASEAVHRIKAHQVGLLHIFIPVISIKIPNDGNVLITCILPCRWSLILIISI